MTQCSAKYAPLIAPQILDGLDRTGVLSERCLRLLQDVCGYWMVLPSTYEVSDELSVNTALPFTFDGFCYIYKGTLSGENVCIRQLWMLTGVPTGDQAAARRVTRFYILCSTVKP